MRPFKLVRLPGRASTRPLRRESPKYELNHIPQTSAIECKSGQIATAREILFDIARAANLGLFRMPGGRQTRRHARGVFLLCAQAIGPAMIQDALAQLQPAQSGTDRRHSILIVDDDQAQVEVLSHRLNKQGFSTVLAYEGRAGLQ